MNASTSISWTELFESKGDGEITVRVGILKKAGEPFLVFPKSPRLAAQALTLYPAQTRFARGAKAALRTVLRAGLPGPLKQTTIKISQDDPFAQFFRKLGAADGNAFPPFAILCGNPRAEGRRFIVLLFDPSGKPSMVVKAGVGNFARQLVLKEKTFLQSVALRKQGLPKICDSFSSERLEAFATAYVEGDSPRAGDWLKAGELLAGWLDETRQLSAEDLPLWRDLAAKHGADTQFRRLSQGLMGWKFCPALVHGDFAPWNLKVSHANGAWTAVDWERGELAGFPGWDWFHYVIQTGILVEKLPAEKLVPRLEELFNAPVFREYAQAGRFEGRERILAVAYLFHCVKMVRQTEGFGTVSSLLSILQERWIS